MPNPSHPDLLPDTINNQADRYYAFDRKDSRFFILGFIDAYSDTLRLTIITKILSTGESSSIPAEVFFDEMMTYFQSKGGYPNAIRGIWNDSNLERTTNLDRFNHLVLAGKSMEEAAKGTFTGRMAVKYHYTKINFCPSDKPNGPDPYHSVNAYFRK